MLSYPSRAQRWHDTDHGLDRGKPLKTNKFIVALPDVESKWASSCWCCCPECDPEDSERSNPYWELAKGNPA